ncbi:MAG: PstS family phosphate ABC transporter substrate-binding protein [Firmicutes bacterium]|nr:PstS family phosphate ABC transporter substrate-binding protein [Bacillota bacterium]
MAKGPRVLAAMVTALSLVLFGCGGPGGQGGAPSSGSELRGEIRIDGSSTVYPITEAVAEEFQREHRGVRVTIGVSGSGGGFKKWTKGEVDINNSSRKIRPEEAEAVEKNGLGYVEIPVAYDGIVVAVHAKNDWATCVTVEELHEIWKPDSKVTRWNQVRPEWPDLELKLYGPGTDSGTFEYFTEHINKQAGASRTDYTASEDDNLLIQGVMGDRGALGYFGYAYYVENRGAVKALAVDGGQGCVEPTDETIQNGTYPLARPVYIYPTRKALERPEVRAFVEFYLKYAPVLVPAVGYTPLPQEKYDEILKKIQ